MFGISYAPLSTLNTISKASSGLSVTSLLFGIALFSVCCAFVRALSRLRDLLSDTMVDCYNRIIKY